MFFRPLIRWASVALICTTLITGDPLQAAEPDDSGELAPAASSQLPTSNEVDFLFGRPRWYFGLSGGWHRASQSSEVFDFARKQLTVDKGAFDGSMVRVALGRSVARRVDVVFELDVSGATVPSEYRDFVDNNYTADKSDDLPILQTTKLRQLPLTGSVRYWLKPRGREIGRYAWVPNRVAPYLGAGGGTQWYQFEQTGEFVDFRDYSIFNGLLRSDGWGATGHVFGGTSIKLSRRVFAGVEIRYSWSDTPLSKDFIGFDNIDLGGLRLTLGIELVG